MHPHSDGDIAFSASLAVDQRAAALDGHRYVVQPCTRQGVDGVQARSECKSPSPTQISFHLGSVPLIESQDGTNHKEMSVPSFPSASHSLPPSTVRRACNTIAAPFLSRSSLPLPQRGDWTQAGQPERHWQCLRWSSVAAARRKNC